jgi:ComF family protein
MSEKLSSMLTDAIYANNFQKYLSNSILLPVPSSKQRSNERGFNQVDLIAESISKNFNLVYDNTILYRKFQFGHQALRDRQERLDSADNSFYIKDYSILKSFKTITIVDDVITTGKTLENIRNLFPKEYSFQALCLFRGKPFYSSFGSSFLTKSRSSVDICL